VERRFLREALLSLGSERPGLRDAARTVRNWDRALADARAGSVAESVWAAMVLRGLEGEIPEPARSAFEEAHVGATARNALLLSEAASVQAALAAAGIESIVLKGPGLLVAHYPDIGARHVGDVDLLVRERESQRADEIVRSLGAREREPLLRYDGTRAGHAEPGEVHSPLVYTAHGVAVEMHQAQPGEGRGGSDFEGLLARSRIVSWQGRHLRIPSAADLSAGACMHVFDHHDGREKFLPRLLGDLAVTVGAGAVTWKDVEAPMPPGGARKSLEAGRRLLDEGPTPGLAAWRHALGVRAGHWRDVFEVQGRSPGGLVRVLFPAREYMATRYGVSRTSPLLPLLYLWRPLRGAWGLVTGR
jgi:hypothetical protein